MGRREEVSAEIDSLTAVIDSLRTEIELLRSDSSYMEKAVREILGWGRPDELVIRLIRQEGGGGEP